MKTLRIWPIVVALGTAGCVSQAQFLDNMQGSALEAAVNRGRFDLSCPQATGLVLSREVAQPVLEGLWVGGIQRAEYTVSVTGCGKKVTYIAICPEGGESCFAAESRKHNG